MDLPENADHNHQGAMPSWGMSISPALMPAAFIGHGSPMNTLESNRYTAAWRAFGAALPRPRAVLCISAHWFIHGSAITAMLRPRVIHDFFGFPPELFAFDYPAPGSPEIAEEIAEAVKPHPVALDRDSWGLDHGTWSVLAHVFPRADVPVLQLSVHAGREGPYHLALGQALERLRSRGILVLASGNVVHNLRMIDFGRPDMAFDWGVEFDAAVKDTMTRDPASLPSIASHAAYRFAVPTPDHFFPLYYIAGLAAAANEPARVLVEGCTMGSISMTSYVVGDVSPHPDRAIREGAATLPDPRIIPADDTNT
jgi:4,5-DOPA dioxygenase extradiol